MERSYLADIWTEISHEKKMTFLSGPRQCGKTTFAKTLQNRYTNSMYCNWDIPRDKKRILATPAFFEEVERKDTSRPLVILDEIHKFRKWKNYLKGIYDGYAVDYNFLILGSGRLDIYQKGGDSLAGRYFEMSMFPLTIAELCQSRLPFSDFVHNPHLLPDNNNERQNILEQIENLSGFPEPFLSGKKTFSTRWSTTYGRQLIKEDLRDATLIRQIDQVELLYEVLPSKIGSPISYENLANDIQTSGPTIKSWIETFESLFILFRISPWTTKISRAITREQKVYFFNPSIIDATGPRLENLTAIELLRAISSWNDRGLGRFSLHYLRNKDKDEVDFLVANNRKPLFMVEVKHGDLAIASSTVKFQNMLKIPAIVLTGKADVWQTRINNDQKILLVSASHWLAGLP